MARIRYDLPGGLWLRMTSPTHLDFGGFTAPDGQVFRLWNPVALAEVPPLLDAAGAVGRAVLDEAGPYLPLCAMSPARWPASAKIVTLAPDHFTVTCDDDTLLVRLRRDEEGVLRCDRGDWIAATGSRTCPVDQGREVAPARLPNRAALTGVPDTSTGVWDLALAYDREGLGVSSPEQIAEPATPMMRPDGQARALLSRARCDGLLGDVSYAEQIARLVR